MIELNLEYMFWISLLIFFLGFLSGLAFYQYFFNKEKILKKGDPHEERN
jgi:hypothetical protein